MDKGTTIRKMVKGKAKGRSKVTRRGSRGIPGLTASAVPLQVEDDDSSSAGQYRGELSSQRGMRTPPSSTTGAMGSTMGSTMLTAEQRQAILASVATDGAAKPADRLRAVQLLDEMDRRGGGQQRARSLFSIVREPSLVDAPPMAPVDAQPQG